MSLKTLVVIAGVMAGALALGDRANAQVITATSTGGYYSPGVVTPAYYAPAASWSYYGSPAYYSPPLISSYSAAPVISSYSAAPVYGYNYPAYSGYYGAYPYYPAGVYAGPRRWWR